MEKKKITVTIKDKDGKVLLEYSEPVEISRGAMENITWIKKGVWTIKELLNINISQELDRAREEVLLELLKKKTNYKIERVDHGYKVTQEYVLVSDIEKELSKLKQ